MWWMTQKLMTSSSVVELGAGQAPLPVTPVLQPTAIRAYSLSTMGGLSTKIALTRMGMGWCNAPSASKVTTLLNLMSFENVIPHALDVRLSIQHLYPSRVNCNYFSANWPKCYEQSRLWSGDELAKLDELSHEHCAIRCRGYPDCDSWHWKDNKDCFLFSGGGDDPDTDDKYRRGGNGCWPPGGVWEGIALIELSDSFHAFYVSDVCSDPPPSPVGEMTRIWDGNPVFHFGIVR